MPSELAAIALVVLYVLVRYRSPVLISRLRYAAALVAVLAVLVVLTQNALWPHGGAGIALSHAFVLAIGVIFCGLLTDRPNP
jgi:preprotein translocase subunit SecD